MRIQTEHQQRNARTRDRVVDALNQIGHGNQEEGKVRFIDHAIWVAKRREMRLWKAGSPDQLKYIATRSLETLLGEVQVPNENGNDWTGVNLGWVLSIWESALDDWFRVDEARVVGQPEPVVSTSLAEAIDARKPLALRILEAYTTGDDEAIVLLVEEVERLT